MKSAGSKSAEWFADEDFWKSFAFLMFDEAHWAEAPENVEAVLALSGARAGARVLDACCGPGRHSLEFASRGFRVTGVDITEAFLEAARESAAASRLEAEFVHGDIRDFVLPGAYDLCVNLFTSFGYFATREEDILALSNLASCLAPEGCLVLETRGKETTAREFVGGEEFERGGWSVKTEFSVLGDWEMLRNRWMLIRDGRTIDRSFDLRLYSGVEMRNALHAAGFSRVSIFGALDGRPYDQDAQTLVAVARR